MVLASHIQTAIDLARQYGVKRLFLFGSALHSPETARDLDLACEGLSGWNLYELAAAMEESLNIPLDLIPLSPVSALTQKIEREGQRLR